MEAERIVLYYKKSTPGTHVYENRDNDSIPSVYIKKRARFLQGGTPKGIVLMASILPEEEAVR